MAIIVALITVAGVIIAAGIGYLALKRYGGGDSRTHSGASTDSRQAELAYWLGRPGRLDKRFLGRRDELKSLSKAFKSQRTVVLSGGPGVGKSQLAAECTYDSRRKGFWSPGGENVIQTFVALAEQLGVDQEERTEEQIFNDVRRRLLEFPRKDLWVVDNLASLDQVNSILAESGEVRLLVTTRDSRNHLLPEDVVSQQVGVLEAGPAVNLLRRGTRYDSADPILREIVEEVGQLPLAVEMLSFQLRAEWQTPAGLLEEIRGAPTAVQLTRFRESAKEANISNEGGVLAAIRGPLENLPQDLRQRLSPLGYIADLPMSRDFLKAMTGLEDDTALNNLLEECNRRSILAFANEQVTIHSLTAAAIAATNDEQAMETALVRAAPRLAAIRQNDFPALRRELPHYEVMYSQAKNVVPAEDTNLLWFSNSLANAYSDGGRYKEAIALHGETLRTLERVLGLEHPDTLNSSNNLAAAYGDAGRYEEAIHLFEETLRVREGVLGPEHPDTLGSRNNLAATYGDAGRYEEAIVLHEETLRVRKRVQDPDYPATLTSRSNLARAYRAMGRYEEAIALHEETLKVRERVLGPEHPDTLMSRNNLAATYSDAGRYQEALALFEETLRVRERVLGPEHPDTLMSRNNLAAAYGTACRYDEAIPLQQETLSLMERILGREHPETLTCRNNLSQSYRAVGRGNEAEALFSDEQLAIEINESPHR